MGLFKRKNKSHAPGASSNQRSKFFKNKKKPTGRISIAKNKSPYLGKTIFPKLKKRQKVRKSSSMILPPGRLKPSNFYFLKKILIGLLSIFIIGGLSYFAFFTDFFLINEYHVYEDEIEITNNLPLNGLITDSLANENILLYNDEVLKLAILEQNPEYEFIYINKVLPSTIEVELEKYPQAANILNEVRTPEGLNLVKKFIINTNGLIIKENEENAELPYIKISTENSFQLNTLPIERDNLDKIIKLINLFEEKFGIEVIEAVYLKKARELHLRTAKEFTVWLDLTKEILPQIDKLKMALPKLDIYNTPLDYIDLRISGIDAEKVIFKRR
ncbi:MAG: hypothetical protein ACRCZE_04165 [Candidatus Altimarinota bacterium]